MSSNVGFHRNLYPSDYRTAFAFSDLLYPHLLKIALRLTCLYFNDSSTGEDTGLPCSAIFTGCFGFLLYAVSLILYGGP